MLSELVMEERGPYYYAVTCQPATRVRAACVGSFLSPTDVNLILAKGNRLEVYRLTAEVSWVCVWLGCDANTRRGWEKKSRGSHVRIVAGTGGRSGVAAVRQDCQHVPDDTCRRSYATPIHTHACTSNNGVGCRCGDGRSANVSAGEWVV
jgi:hypothetical protein